MHLVDGHLSGVPVNKLDETAAFAGGDLDVGDFTKALEERSELILSDVARQPTDKDGRVVGVSELVHLSGRVVTTIWEPALHGSSSPHGLLRNTAHHGAASVVSVAGTETLITAVSWHHSQRRAPGSTGG